MTTNYVVHNQDNGDYVVPVHKGHFHIGSVSLGAHADAKVWRNFTAASTVAYMLNRYHENGYNVSVDH